MAQRGNIKKRAPDPNRIGAGKPGPGRPKGSRTTMTNDVVAAIVEAGNKAGGKGGLVSYLQSQAKDNPKAFMSLLGRVIPSQSRAETDSLRALLAEESAQRRALEEAHADAPGVTNNNLNLFNLDMSDPDNLRIVMDRMERLLGDLQEMKTITDATRDG